MSKIEFKERSLLSEWEIEVWKAGAIAGTIRRVALADGYSYSYYPRGMLLSEPQSSARTDLKLLKDEVELHEGR